MSSPGRIWTVTKVALALILVYALYQAYPSTYEVLSSQIGTGFLSNTSSLPASSSPASSSPASSSPASSSPASSSPTSSSQKVAVIIENRKLGNLAALILHFSSVLGPTWPIILYTPDNVVLGQSLAFQRAVSAGRVSLRSLPENLDFQDRQAVSGFLTDPWIWEQLAPADHVLLFQADSILCANANKTVDDYLDYDFVGAPINPSGRDGIWLGQGYNGGLSLRNRTLMLDIVTKSSWKKEIQDGLIGACVVFKPCRIFEDQWFYDKMTQVPGVRLPTLEEASTFAVETIWYDRPLGYHQVERWQADRVDEITAWCPEYTMSTKDLIIHQ